MKQGTIKLYNVGVGPTLQNYKLLRPTTGLITLLSKIAVSAFLFLYFLIKILVEKCV